MAYAPSGAVSFDDRASATEMAELIFGDGVEVRSASYTGDRDSSAIYTANGHDASFPSTRGVILSTGDADRYEQTSYWDNSNRSTNSSGESNEADFNQAAGRTTYDASWLDVTFVPDGDVMTMQFVFASEEYPEYAQSQFNDVFVVWVNGQQIPLSAGDGRTSVSNVNDDENENLYVDNTNNYYWTAMDGFTLTLSLNMPVNAGVENDIKIGIADTSDYKYDSSVLIAADSVQTTLVAVDDSYAIQENVTKTVDVLANDENNTNGTLQITHINGQPVTAGSTVTLSTGQTIKLNADGTFDITTGPNPEDVSFTYGVSSIDGSGAEIQDSTGMVSLEVIPCFVAGTLIDTPNGQRAVENLKAGDWVTTVDDGPQQLLWTGEKEVEAVDALAPIEITAGTYGNHSALRVSPQHRILVRDTLAELLFGEGEVLVKAKDLVNGKSVKRVEGGHVRYCHILFDKHQVVLSNGLASESFYPGVQTVGVIDEEALEELQTLFPELAQGKGYGPAARMSLKSTEAIALTKGVA